MVLTGTWQQYMFYLRIETLIWHFTGECEEEEFIMKSYIIDEDVHFIIYLNSHFNVTILYPVKIAVLQ